MRRIKTLKRRRRKRTVRFRTWGGADSEEYHTPNPSQNYQSAEGSSRSSSRSRSSSKSRSKSRSPPKVSGPKPPPGPPPKVSGPKPPPGPPPKPARQSKQSPKSKKSVGVLKNLHPGSFRGRSHEKRGQAEEANVKGILTFPSKIPALSIPEYDTTTEPEFWRPLFEKGEMMDFRNRLQVMMKQDCGDLNERKKINNKEWSICQLNKTLISTYFIPEETEIKKDPVKGWSKDSNVDFTLYNILLCASLMVFGVISMKMKDQPYELILKGGKAIQLVLAEAKFPQDYKTEDIDVLIRPKKGYHAEEIKFVTSHIANLAQWFLQDPLFEVSVQTPDPDPSHEKSKQNKFLYKLSYTKKKMLQSFVSGHDTVKTYNPLSDMDFSELPARIQPFFKHLFEKEVRIHELNQTVFFRCPDVGSLLYEKLYYYSKYESLLQSLTRTGKVNDPEYEETTKDDCDRYMRKFKPAILALNYALKTEAQSYGYEHEDLLFPLWSRLIHLGFGPNHPGSATHRLIGLLLKVDKKEE